MMMKSKSEPGRWDDDQVLFEIDHGQRRVTCSVSREALEEAGPGPAAARWELLNAFETLRGRIERIARDKLHAEPDAPARNIHITAGDLNDPAPAAPAVALRRRVAAR